MERELVESVEVSGYKLRVTKYTFNSGEVEYLFGTDNPIDVGIDKVMRPEITIGDDSRGFAYVSFTSMRDFDVEDVEQFIEYLNTAKNACNIFNERINKYRNFEE